MDPNLLKNLGLDDKINQNDINLLNQILNSTIGNNKVPKITAKDRNNLINKLSASNTLSNVPEKELKDMNDEEKKIYREELKKKLKNKQNEKKMLRTNHIMNNDYSNAIGKLSTMMNELNSVQQNTNIDTNLDTHIDTNIDTNIDKQNKTLNVDKFNEFLNTDINKNENENLDDYIK